MLRKAKPVRPAKKNTPSNTSSPPDGHRASDRTIERLLALPEAAELIGISIKSLRRRIETGELPVFRDQRVVRIRPADLRQYINARWNG